MGRHHHRHVVAALAAAEGCSRSARYEGPLPISLPLVVRNHGTFDVTVDLVLAGGARGRRVATVSGYASDTVTLGERDLQPGGYLAVRLHAIGSAYSWVSPAVSVGRDMMAYLDIHANRNGELGRSSLWATPVATDTQVVDPIDTAAARSAAGGG